MNIGLHFCLGLENSANFRRGTSLWHFSEINWELSFEQGTAVLFAMHGKYLRDLPKILFLAQFWKLWRKTPHTFRYSSICHISNSTWGHCRKAFACPNAHSIVSIWRLSEMVGSEIPLRTTRWRFSEAVESTSKVGPLQANSGKKFHLNPPNSRCEIEIGGTQHNKDLENWLGFCIWKNVIAKCEDREKMVMSNRVISDSKCTSQKEHLPLVLITNNLLK